MNLNGAYILVDIFSNIEIYMLIFIRFIGLLAVLPVISGRSIPVMARVGLALALSGIVYTSGMITEVQYDDNTIGYVMLILKEFVTGLIIGYIVYFMFNVTYFAGHLADQQIGLSMANVYDPVTQVQVPISGNLFYFGLCVFFIVTGTYRLVIQTLFYSFKALPLGSAVIVGNEKLTYLMIELMSKFFSVGISMALPILGTILAVDVALGVLVKAVPRMNIFVVGMPLKLLIGLFAIWLIMPIIGQIYIQIFEIINEYMLSTIKVMMS